MYIGILDDDKNYIDILKEKLDVFGNNVYKVYNKLTEEIFIEQFDLFFLDVMLDGKESFSFGEQFSLNNSTTVLVYISSMDDFVYDSIYQTSFFFIRKSNLEKDLVRLFDKYNKNIFDRNRTIEFISNSVKTCILQSEIIYISSKKNLIIIRTHNQEYKVYKTLTYVYDLLEHNKFYRLNSYVILNFEAIKAIKTKSILMSNEEEIIFTKNSKGSFIEAYAIYKRGKLWN